jgi:hypothetical protein
MKILSTDDGKLIIQSQRFEYGRRLKLTDLIMPSIFIFLCINSQYKKLLHTFEFSSELFLGILLTLISFLILIYEVFFKTPNFIPKTIFEVRNNRVLVKVNQGSWHLNNLEVSRVIELNDIESIDLVLDAKADIYWDSEIDTYAMLEPQSYYQINMKSVSGEQCILERNSVDISQIHPIALTAFCELIEESKRSVQEVEKFLNLIKVDA